MSIRSALKVLDELTASLEDARPMVQAKGLEEYHLRDMAFVQKAKSYLASKDRQKIRWLLAEIPQLSHGFGSYCPDQRRLDGRVDRLFSALKWTWANWLNNFMALV